MAQSRMLAMDPGENTGWAYFVNGELRSQGTIANAADGVADWIHEGNCPNYTRLVLEAFVVQPDFVGRAHASEVVGVMIYDAVLQGAPYSFQLRSQKAVLTRGDETKRFQWLRDQGFDGVSHELDAITHGLLRLRLEGHKPTVEKYWPN